jgi:SAM-dependent methyltransferase
MSLVGRFRHLLGQAWLATRRRGSLDYWESRYRLGMNSGSGSMGELAKFKARVLNDFVREHGVQTVVEFGCGDGMQLALAEYPRYLGIDVSAAAIELCQRRFAGDDTKRFRLQQGRSGTGRTEPADLALSLDVIYHLLEDDVYSAYLADLFGAARQWVIVYSSNREEAVRARHVQHRRFVDDVSREHPAFELVRKIDNPYPAESFADFYIFRRASPPAESRA